MIVSLDTAKEWLKVQHDEEDELITALVLSVQGMVEDRCRVHFDEEAPMPVQLAVKLMVCFFYEQRDPTLWDLPLPCGAYNTFPYIRPIHLRCNRNRSLIRWAYIFLFPQRPMHLHRS